MTSARLPVARRGAFGPIAVTTILRYRTVLCRLALNVNLHKCIGCQMLTTSSIYVDHS